MPEQCGIKGCKPFENINRIKDSTLKETLTLRYFDTIEVETPTDGYYLKGWLQKKGITNVAKFAENFSAYLTARIDIYTGDGIVIQVGSFNGKTVRVLSKNDIQPSIYEWSGSIIEQLDAAVDAIFHGDNEALASNYALPVEALEIVVSN